MAAALPPKVSVIIPAYNVTAYIAEALDSLRAQTFRDFETIVVNDGCPDTANLERVLGPYRDEIVYLKQPNGGVASARNTALGAARGELISLLDPDDVWEPEYLEVQTTILDSRPEVDLVYPDAVFFGDTPWAGATIMEKFPSEGEVTFEKLALLECRVFVGVTVRREVLFRAGLFDTDLKSAEDYDLWLRLSRMGAKLSFHTQRLVKYRSRMDSLSHDTIALARSVLKVYDKFLSLPDLSLAERRFLEEARKIQRANFDLYTGKRALYAGDAGEARERLTRANRIIRNRKISVALFMLRFAPALLGQYIRKKYPTEFSFLN